MPSPSADGAIPPRLSAALELLDELAEREATIERVLVDTARSLGCNVGARFSDGASWVGLPDGSTTAQTPPADAIVRRLPDDSLTWLVPGNVDLSAEQADILLRRLAITLKVAHRREPVITNAASAVHTIIDPRSGSLTRAHALSQLGLTPSSIITTIAAHGPREAIAAFMANLAKSNVQAYHSPVTPVHAILLKGSHSIRALNVPVGMRIGFTARHEADDAARAWETSFLALRFTRPSTHAHGPYFIAEATLVNSVGLGSFKMLASTLRLDEIAANVDVQQLGVLVSEHGDEILVCLEAVAATDSLRKAARLLHLHHNSVAHRVERAEKRLGFSFTEPYGRNRLFLGLVLRRLYDSGVEIGEASPLGAASQPVDR